MTDLLKDTLTQHANSAEPPGLDLDSIISTGDRRIRRRRTVAVVGTAMVTLAVVATGLTLLKPGPTPVATAFAERRATYAVGSDIHYGSDVISIAPKKIIAFVQTDAGFVFTSTGDSGLFLADGNQVSRLGKGPGELGELTAGTRGNLVGWVEGFNDRYESVVYDVAARRELVRTALGNKVPPNVSISIVAAPTVIAIDGGYAYLGTLQGVYRWDLETGESQLILRSTDPRAIRALADDRYVLDAHPERFVGPDDVDVVLKDISGNNTKGTYPGKQGYLSPSAKYLLTGTNDPQRITPPPTDLKLFDTTTNKQLPLAHPNHPRLIFNQWLTDETFTAAGLRLTPQLVQPGLNSPVDLLTCSTKTLTCQVTTPNISTLTFTTTPPRTAPFALPIGTPIRWLYG